MNYDGVLGLMLQLIQPVQNTAGMFKGHTSLNQALRVSRLSERGKEKQHAR